MSHPKQLQFLNEVSNLLFKEKIPSSLNILEIGSYEVNGSIRDFFKGTKYLGIDLVKGPGVDLVMSGENIKELNKKFDLIISSECFEHAIGWKNIFEAMINNTKDDGYIIMTCASKGRTEHGTSRSDFYDTVVHKHEVKSSPGTNDEYYKNLTKKDFFKNFDISKIFEDYFFYYNIHSFDLYFAGKKKNTSKSTFLSNLKKSVIKSNSYMPAYRSIKRFILHTLLSEKICNDLHFRNLKRKLKRIKITY